MKLKEFLKGRGVWQHLVCFLLYALQIVVLLVLMETFEDKQDMVIGGTAFVFLPVSIWFFGMIFCDVGDAAMWLWRLIVPKKWRAEAAKLFAPKVHPVVQKAVKPAEDVIFRMWEDATVWKDGGLYYRKKGEYQPITFENARELERGYHRYQMSMDVNRGGAPDEVARRARGFDENGNYVGGYAVDSFWMRRFGCIPETADEIIVTRCTCCGKALDAPVKTKKDGDILCKECKKDQAAAAKSHVKTVECVRCGSLINQNEATVREGSAYCASCAKRLQIKPRPAPKRKNEVRCEYCNMLLKAGEVVSRGGAPYCKKCADMPDKAKDRKMLETPRWSIVWNEGKLYEYSKYGGYKRIQLYKAREMEREYMLGMHRSCLERGLLTAEKADEMYRVKDGKFMGPYAVDALTDGRWGTLVFGSIIDYVIWMDGRLQCLSLSGECKPISMDEARRLEYDYWNDMAARAYRDAETERFEYAQSKMKETKDGWRLKEYAVDEFMKKQQAAAEPAVKCRRCGAELNEKQQHKRGTSVYCLDCFKAVEADAKKRDHEVRKSMWELKQHKKERFSKPGEQTAPAKAEKEGTRMGKDALVPRNKEQEARSGAAQPRQQKEAEIEIFRMWGDAIVWKDDSLQLRKQGVYTPLTPEKARELEEGFHYYQMTQDIQRGGASEDVARWARGFDMNGKYIGEYAVDKFSIKRFGRVFDAPENILVTHCMRCGKKLDEPVMKEGDGYSYICCKDCTDKMGNVPAKVKICRVDKEFCPTDIVVDGLIYRKVPAGMILIGVEVGAKAAVVHGSIDGHPLMRVDKHAFDDCDPALKLTFEPGFRMEVKRSDYKPDTEIQFLPRLPGFTGERVMEIGNYHGPDLVREYLYYSDDHTQTVRERFEYHGFDAVYTVVLE